MGVERRKMTTHSQCLLHTLLPILLLLNTWVSAGFISPGNSVSIRTSPTLRFLLACGHLTTKPPIFSTHDIYTNDQVFRAISVFISAYGSVFLFVTRTKNGTFTGGEGSAPPPGCFGSARDRGGGGAGEEGGQKGKVCQRELSKEGTCCVY